MRLETISYVLYNISQLDLFMSYILTKKTINKKSQSEVNWLLIILAIVVLSLAAYYFRRNTDLFRLFVEENPFWGLFLYLLIGVVDVIVISPGVSLPLIPVAGRIWGSFPAAILILTAWSAGSFLAFILVRIYGLSFVTKFISLQKLENFKRNISKNLFWRIVLLRIVFPTDIFSYALGLFTDISFGRYLAATVIGVAPSAIILAYVGKLPVYFEISTYLIGAVVFIWLVRIAGRLLR